MTATGVSDDERSDIQEALAHLYLRLNGYFTSGFIAHSPNWYDNRAEFDALAVRLSFNREPERLVEASEFLCPEAGITDLLVCEVKSRGQPLQFNDGARQNKDILRTALRWAGVVDEHQLPEAAARIQDLIQPGVNRDTSQTGYRAGSVRIRPLLLSPERSGEPRANQPWFAGGREMLGFVNLCLNPQAPRASCSTQYDFTAWGRWLGPLVTYFKGLRDDAPAMEVLYSAVVGSWSGETPLAGRATPKTARSK